MRKCDACVCFVCAPVSCCGKRAHGTLCTLCGTSEASSAPMPISTQCVAASRCRIPGHDPLTGWCYVTQACSSTTRTRSNNGCRTCQLHHCRSETAAPVRHNSDVTGASSCGSAAAPVSAGKWEWQHCKCASSAAPVQEQMRHAFCVYTPAQPLTLSIIPKPRILWPTPHPQHSS